MEHFGRVPMACSTAEARMIDELRGAMAAGADRDRLFALMEARNRIVLKTWDAALCEATLDRSARTGMQVSPTLDRSGFLLR